MSVVPRLLKPLDDFLRVETASGLLLLGAAAAALIWANSGWHAGYEAVWDTPSPGVGASPRFIINEMLMAVFFLVAGLEIRRELHDGALSTPAQAALPLVGAAGGIVLPAVIYLGISAEAAQDGWAVPTATDIAFAVGVLALLGKRIDPSLRVLLLAIAIVDDIAAVLIIAFFYAEGIAVGGVALAAAGAGGVWLCHRLRVNAWLASGVPGALVWYGLHEAGIHPALSGVVVGLLAPMTENARNDGAPAAIRLESALHPWVAFGVMPLFALANAGVRTDGLDFNNGLSFGLAGGVAFGLLVGKPAGIGLAIALAVKSRLCKLPTGVTPAGIIVIGFLGGIGFTMSLFIAALAFAEPALLEVAKLGVLAGSAGAAMMGLLAGWLLLRGARASH